MLFRSTDLTHAQQATRALDEVATWLPIATVAIGAGAIVVSKRRRRTAEYLALGIAVVMVVIAAAAAVGRAYYLARVGAAYRTIAAAPFDALLGPLRFWTRLTFFVALGAFVVIWLTGSQTLVVRERRLRTLLTDAVADNARALAIAGAAIAAVVLVAWDRPRPLVVYTILIALALWELLCFAAGRAGPPHGGTDAPAPAD